MSRRDISMTPAEVSEFVAGRRQFVVGTVGSDGWPMGTIARSTAGSTTDGGREVVLAFAEGDPMIEQLGSDPSLCLVADEHESYFEIRGVIVHGNAVGVGDHSFRVDIDRIISFDFGRLR